MRVIQYEHIVHALEKLSIESAYELPADVLSALRTAEQNESNPRAKRILGQLVENAEIAKDQCIPLCQDTGVSVVFVEQGAAVVIQPPEGNPDATFTDAIQQGVQNGYGKGLLRKSVVAEPLQKRENTRTNTPAIIHHTIVPGDKIKIAYMAKGGGCENKSQFKMFNPTEDKQIVMDWIVQVVRQAGANACPPFVVGVGIGGDFELSCILSKKALLRDIHVKNPDPFYARMEEDLLKAVNHLNVGPQGFGGDTTALAVCVEKAACHIASLPVAVNIECHSHRHKSIVL